MEVSLDSVDSSCSNYNHRRYDGATIGGGWVSHFYIEICTDKPLKTFFPKTILPEKLKLMWKHPLEVYNLVWSS